MISYDQKEEWKGQQLHLSYLCMICYDRKDGQLTHTQILIQRKDILLKIFPFFLAFFTKENKLVGKRGDFERASQAPDLSSQTTGDTHTAYISERTALNPI